MEITDVRENELSLQGYSEGRLPRSLHRSFERHWSCYYVPIISGFAISKGTSAYPVGPSPFAFRQRAQLHISSHLGHLRRYKLADRVGRRLIAHVLKYIACPADVACLAIGVFSSSFNCFSVFAVSILEARRAVLDFAASFDIAECTLECNCKPSEYADNWTGKTHLRRRAFWNIGDSRSIHLGSQRLDQ
jgi:hypothetical protein